MQIYITSCRDSLQFQSEEKLDLYSEFSYVNKLFPPEIWYNIRLLKQTVTLQMKSPSPGYGISLTRIHITNGILA